MIPSALHGQTVDSLITLARRQYTSRSLGQADASLLQAVALLRQERSAHAADLPPTDRPTGTPLPVGGIVTEPLKTKDAQPVLSQDALRAGAAGIVMMAFVVTKTGTVDNIRVVKSVPLIDDAARGAVKKW